MRHDVSVSTSGITRIRFRRRTLPASEIRRVHVYTDADGSPGLVLRSALFRYVFLSSEELHDPSLQAGVRSLVDQVRDHAHVDEDVDRFLASVA
jgi:hypothetical protein